MDKSDNSSDYVILPRGIDHLFYASPTLERGMDAIEASLGVRPVPGGRHPRFGTHNALLSLGPAAYLEVIARDPDLPAPDRGRLVNLSDGQQPRLMTWVVRVSDLAAFIRDPARAASGIGQIEGGRREQADGSLIEWQLTDPYAMPMNGAIPFLIDWGNTTHPAQTAPAGGELTGLRIEHPDPGQVHATLKTLETDADVIKADEFRLTARIQTGDGVKFLS
ncbi:MAG: VOC family protein, partial [Woeseiaceae bacterium]